MPLTAPFHLACPGPYRSPVPDVSQCREVANSRARPASSCSASRDRACRRCCGSPGSRHLAARAAKSGRGRWFFSRNSILCQRSAYGSPCRVMTLRPRFFAPAIGSCQFGDLYRRIAIHLTSRPSRAQGLRREPERYRRDGVHVGRRCRPLGGCGRTGCVEGGCEMAEADGMGWH